jgi:ribonuclease J
MRACIRGSATQIDGTRVELESKGRRLQLDLGLGGGLRVGGLEHLEDRKRVTRGPFSVTPFLVDPSVRDASAILVAADGVSALYVGDLRAGILDKLLLAPPPHVDLLLMEGATIGSATNTDGFATESDFEDQFASIFRQTKGMSLVWCSPQNVDRIVTIYRACLRTNRQFVVDRATADLLRTTIAPVPVPREVWEGIRVFASSVEKPPARRAAGSAAAEAEGPPAISPDDLGAVAGNCVVLFRPSMMNDLERTNALIDARLVFSMWSGYLEYENSNPVLEWLDRHNIPLDQFHTSGHAAIIELVELRRAFAAAPVVPIGRHPERFAVLFGKVERRAVGEWWDVQRTP